MFTPEEELYPLTFYIAFVCQPYFPAGLAWCNASSNVLADGTSFSCHFSNSASPETYRSLFSSSLEA